MKRKARRWWIIGGVGLLFFGVAAVAFITRVPHFQFLQRATLQNVDIYDVSRSYYSGRPNESITIRMYASQIEFDDLLQQMRAELTSRGYAESRDSQTLANRQVGFTNGDVSVHISEFTIPKKDEPRCFIYVKSRTNFIDRIQDNYHRDRFPNL